MMFGEVNTNAEVNFELVARQAIKEVGYTSAELGMDCKTATIIVAMDRQSHEIASSVHVDKKEEDVGAGDQGLMIGYASNETENLMPLSHDLSCKLVRRLEKCRREKIVDWMRPDAKVQVTVEYRHTHNNIVPERVHTILISCQHNPGITNDQIR